MTRPLLSVRSTRRRYRETAAPSRLGFSMADNIARACAKCRFAQAQRPNPPDIIGVLLCRWGPRHLTQIPTPQGIINASNFPIVAPDDWCYQFMGLPGDDIPV